MCIALRRCEKLLAQMFSCKCAASGSRLCHQCRPDRDRTSRSSPGAKRPPSTQLPFLAGQALPRPLPRPRSSALIQLPSSIARVEGKWVDCDSSVPRCRAYGVTLSPDVSPGRFVSLWATEMWDLPAESAEQERCRMSCTTARCLQTLRMLRTVRGPAVESEDARWDGGVGWPVGCRVGAGDRGKVGDGRGLGHRLHAL